MFDIWTIRFETKGRVEFSVVSRRQKETRENLIQAEVDRRVKEIVESRVRDELERRKDEIENEVKRRVDVFKRNIEKQMLLEFEKRNNDEMKKLAAQEVKSKQRICVFHVNLCCVCLKEEERKKREHLERILVENERKLADAEKRLVSFTTKLIAERKKNETLRLFSRRKKKKNYEPNSYV